MLFVYVYNLWNFFHLCYFRVFLFDWTSLKPKYIFKDMY